jgi:nifR3 family TIM-barrel protein
MKIQLGRLEIDSPLVLAPIAGFTDAPYRSIARAHGAGFVMTELVSVEGIVRDNIKTIDLLRFDDSERPIGIQIFGRKAVTMANAARIVEELNPEFIDINMGCPARKVCKDGEGAGSALIRDPKLVEQIARAVREAVSLPVSAKIRIGWDASSLNYRETAKALESAGVDFISVHGRTKAQGYGGEADWDAIGEVARAVSLPVIGNGDIETHAGAMERLSGYGCAAVMIGRGACGNPWIFSGREPGLEERITQIKDHLDRNMAFYGDWGLVLMRKHTVKYIHGFPGASQARVGLVRAATREEVHRILDVLLEQPSL